ncbi:MAG TPA: hypothetical protein VFS21_04390 [Roseiflexaceae bacterium]|nr:hypothetical protein [Roseiflexaceae bacterium]
MTIDRHPLLAAGGGLSERQLPDEAVVPYCDALGDRLGWLGSALGAEQQQARISIAAHKATLAFLHEIRATVMVLALKHGRQLLDVEPAPLTIDPTESGMPTVKDFWNLQEDRKHAQQQLAQIPDRPALVDQALDAIFNGRRPVKQQILWLQRAYMERLAATPVVTDFRQMDPVSLPGTRGGDQLYALSWTGLVRSQNLLECVTLHFTERGGWHVSGGKPALRSLIEDLAGGRHSLAEMIGLLNEAPWIIPETIERVTIGPYFHQWTQNDDLIERAFEHALGAEPFILRATIDRAATTRTGKRSMTDLLFGREPREVGPSMRSRLMLVPLGIKQFLGDRDEDDQPCVVYGVSKDGDLVC